MTGRRWKFRSAAVLGAGLFVGVLVVLGGDRGPRNFGVVEPGVLYRSGQLTPRAFEGVLTENRIKTVVSLRPDRGEADNSDSHEDDICRARGITFVRIPPQTAESGGDPLEPVTRTFLAVIDDPANHPVLVHCTAGRDRTGIACAVYRMEHNRWSADRALAEMGEYGFDPDKDEAAGAYARFIRNYRPRAEKGR